MRSDRRGPFSRSLNGFVHFSLTPRAAIVRYIDIDGNVVHAFMRDRQDRISVLDSTGRDMARPRDVKSITRPDAATRPATSISN
jgi:hypothetical protein